MPRASSTCAKAQQIRGISMVEQEWIHFESTGKVSDYLTYSRACGTETGSATDSAKEESTKDGADHCAYRYGAGSYTHRGL